MLPNLFYLLSTTTSTTTSITLIMFIMALYILFPVFLHYAYKKEMGDRPVMIVARIFNFIQMASWIVVLSVLHATVVLTDEDTSFVFLLMCLTFGVIILSTAALSVGNHVWRWLLAGAVYMSVAVGIVAVAKRLHVISSIEKWGTEIVWLLFALANHWLFYSLTVNLYRLSTWKAQGVKDIVGAVLHRHPRDQPIYVTTEMFLSQPTQSTDGQNQPLLEPLAAPAAEDIQAHYTRLQEIGKSLVPFYNSLRGQDNRGYEVQYSSREIQEGQVQQSQVNMKHLLHEEIQWFVSNVLSKYLPRGINVQSQLLYSVKAVERPAITWHRDKSVCTVIIPVLPLTNNARRTPLFDVMFTQYMKISTDQDKHLTLQGAPFPVFIPPQRKIDGIPNMLTMKAGSYWFHIAGNADSNNRGPEYTVVHRAPSISVEQSTGSTGSPPRSLLKRRLIGIVFYLQERQPLSDE